MLQAGALKPKLCKIDSASTLSVRAVIVRVTHSLFFISLYFNQPNITMGIGWCRDALPLPSPPKSIE